MLLTWLASTLGMAALKGGASSIMQRISRGAVIGGVLAVLWLTAFGLAIAALTVWLAGELGTPAALGIVAGGLAVIGLVFQVVVTLTARREKPSGFNIANAFQPAPGSTTTPDGNQLGSMAIVAAAGYLLARQIRK
jgi:hypothetical protein